ncbi:MAG: ATP-binding protein [Bryobacterales bacterium]|nr:ATP-binding protein [Bryobacterales bacterium]
MEKLTRPNSLFLSAAAQNSHEVLVLIYNWFADDLTVVAGDRPNNRGRLTRIAAEVCVDRDLDRSLILRLLSSAELGITDLELECPDDQEREQSKRVLKAMMSALGREGQFQRTLDEPGPKVKLLHRTGDSVVRFELEDESSGTISYLALLGPIIKVLRAGGVLAVDELDSGLHSLLVARIVELFKKSSTNPRHAQLIFNSHDTSLLNRDVLRQDQVWLTETDQRGESHLYPLSDFQRKSGGKISSGYLQGRFGAIPYLGMDLEMGELVHE